MFRKLMVAMAAVALVACNEQANKKSQAEAQVEAAAPTSKSVVVYYSQNGATKKLAEIFAKAKNADAVELKLVTAYPSTYDSTIAAVKAQRESKQWPALEIWVTRLCLVRLLRRFTPSSIPTTWAERWWCRSALTVAVAARCLPKNSRLLNRTRT